MIITLHLSGIGHRRFCGADAAEQADRWAHDARRRIEAPSDDEAEAASGDWGYETPVGAALHEPADIPELGAPVDQDTLIEQYRITCEAQQQTIERLRGIVQRAKGEPQK